MVNYPKCLASPLGLVWIAKRWTPFFMEKIHTKLKFQNTIHLSIVGWAIVVNFVLASTLWLFINILGGIKKLIRKCKYLFQNFLWVGGDQCTKTKVNQFDCCANKGIEGLGFIDPKEAMDALLCKWVIKALKHGNSNFKLLLCFNLAMCKPS